MAGQQAPSASLRRPWRGSNFLMDRFPVVRFAHHRLRAIGPAGLAESRSTRLFHPVSSNALRLLAVRVSQFGSQEKRGQTPAAGQGNSRELAVEFQMDGTDGMDVLSPECGKQLPDTWFRAAGGSFLTGYQLPATGY